MLVIKVEIWPFGDESRAKLLGSGIIANTGTGTPTSGDYKFAFTNAGGRKWKTGTLTGFPRKRLLAWDLLLRALHALLKERDSL